MNWQERLIFYAAMLFVFAVGCGIGFMIAELIKALVRMVL